MLKLIEQTTKQQQQQQVQKKYQCTLNVCIIVDRNLHNKSPWNLSASSNNNLFHGATSGLWNGDVARDRGNYSAHA